MKSRRSFLLAGAALPAAITATFEKAHGMTTFKTGNPIGSTATHDLFDNSQNFDFAVNEKALGTWVDRFGVSRKSWWGIEQDFQSFLLSSGYQDIGDYATGLSITARNQVFSKDGELYRAGSELALPYTTTGDWASEGGFFVAIGDAALRQELAAASGSEMIGHGNQSVSDAIDINAGKIRELRTNSTLKSLLETAYQDIYVLVQGDSTGVYDWTFPRKIAEKIAADHPAWGVVYVPWSHDSTAWGAQQIIQASSNSKAIYIYNGSHSGAVPLYWRGAGRIDKAYDGKKFDLIISNYGLNAPYSYLGQAYCLTEYLMDLRQDQPTAEVIVTIQPPDYNTIESSANRVKAQRWIAEQYGCQIIDAYGLFLSLVAATGNVSDWYLDGVHPNFAGQERWADLAYSSIMLADISGARQPSLVAPVIVPNGVFRHWPAGANSTPLFWKTTSDCIRNTVEFESDISSARFTGHTIGTGLGYCDPQQIVDGLKQLSGFWVAARVYTIQSRTGKSGTAYFARNADSTFESVQANQYLDDYNNTGWRWSVVYVPRSFTQGASNFQLGIFSGEDGDRCSVDRILISAGPVFPDFNGKEEGAYRYSFNAASIDVASGATEKLSFTVPTASPGAVVTFRMNSLNIDLNATAIAGNGIVTLKLTNPTGASITQPAFSVELIVS